MKKKFLVIIDDSQELSNAIYFAANRAIHTDGQLSLLYIVDPAMNAQWARVENLIEQEETSEAKKLCRDWAQKIKKRFNIESEIIIKIGDRIDEIMNLIQKINEFKEMV